MRVRDERVFNIEELFVFNTTRGTHLAILTCLSIISHSHSLGLVSLSIFTLRINVHIVSFTSTVLSHAQRTMPMHHLTNICTHSIRNLLCGWIFSREIYG